MTCANTEPESCRAFDAVFDEIKILQRLDKNICRQNIAALTKCKKEIEELFRAAEAAKNKPCRHKTESRT